MEMEHSLQNLLPNIQYFKEKRNEIEYLKNNPDNKVLKYNKFKANQSIKESFTTLLEINRIIIENCHKRKLKQHLSKFNILLERLIDNEDFEHYKFANLPYNEKDQQIYAILQTIEKKLSTNCLFYFFFKKEDEIMRFYYSFILASFYYNIYDNKIYFYSPNETNPTPHHLFFNTIENLSNDSNNKEIEEQGSPTTQTV